MSAFLMTERARADVEDLVRRLTVGGPRAARRALDELVATMDWLAGQGPRDDRSAEAARTGASGSGPMPDVGEGVRLWPLRDALLAWQPAGTAGDRPAVLLRVLRRDPTNV
jgi:plasmid stabilization system protein ParE